MEMIFVCPKHAAYWNSCVWYYFIIHSSVENIHYEISILFTYFIIGFENSWLNNCLQCGTGVLQVIQIHLYMEIKWDNRL